jgi:hypothetical protein
MNNLLLKIGDTVVVKDGSRDYLKSIYSDYSLFKPAKMKLGLAAANGAELLIVGFLNNNPNSLILANKEIAENATLTLEANRFEPAEEDIDVSEFFK